MDYPGEIFELCVPIQGRTVRNSTPMMASRAAASKENTPNAEDTDTCVVCLQPCAGQRACACSWMHQQCAEAYKETYGACRVCSVDFGSSIQRLTKRKIEHDEAELEIQARKRRSAFEEAERTRNLEWARCIAPSAAHILYRHFRHSGNEPSTDLGFDTIILSLIHSGEQYIEDLAERLSESKPQPLVDETVRRLHTVGEQLVSSTECIDEACREEFLRLFKQTLADRASAPFRWSEE